MILNYKPSILTVLIMARDLQNVLLDNVLG